jgi:hypothetical protein
LGRRSRAWTPGKVEDALVAAFRALPHAPVYGALEAEPIKRAPGPPGPLALLGLTERYLRADPESWDTRADARTARHSDRAMLLTWARARAAGQSLAELCLELGWNRRRLYRRRDAAAAAVARGLNQDGFSAPA